MSSILGRENRRGRVHVRVSQGAAGQTTLLAGVPGKRHKVVGGSISMAVADGSIEWFSGSTSLSGAQEFARRGGFIVNATPEDPEFETEPGEDLIILTTGGAARGWLKIITEE